MPPTRIDWNAGGLTLHWDQPPAITHAPAALLRSACRCAECLHCVPQVDTNVQLVSVELVGHYGLRLFFSDSHARGIFPWSMLHDQARVPGH